MDISVIWLNFSDAPNRGYWCTAWLEEALINAADVTPPHTFFWGTEVDVRHPRDEGAIVIIPAEYNTEYVTKINKAIALLPWAVVFLVSDERGIFPVEDLVLRPQDTLWVMTPHFEKHEYPPGTQFLGEFYPPDARERISQFKYVARERSHPCSFSGQITHQRRVEMAEALEPEAFYINRTPGFTQGLDRDDYYELLTDTITTPAPSGPVTLDSFRAFESLESGGIPILDLVCPVECDGHQYWNAVLGEDHPLPTVFDWNQALPLIDDIAFCWPLSGNLVFSWWQLYKREMRYRILDGVPGITHGEITILIPTSPVPVHPSTEILDETIASVRFHFPTADILVMCDGVRAEQEDRREAYERYVQEVCWKANFEWKNVYPIVFGDHQHQAGMTRAALNHVRTPLIMFVEHDTPLVTDCPIDWDGLLRLATNKVDVVRLHFEAGIHPEHERLMIDHETVELDGVPVRRTVQWSQRPHITKTDFYRWMIHEYFPLTSRTMIEDRVHGAAIDAPGLFNIVIYHPPGGNIKRSLHSDARGDDEKYPMVYK